MNGLTPALALLVGLASTLHCWGMCGGIVGALAVSLPEHLRSAAWARARLVTLYNIGRIASYTLAGTLAGAGAAALSGADRSGLAYLVLQICGAVVLVLVGAHLSGILPRLALLEEAGWRLWRRLQPLARRFIPIDSAPRALIAGAIWGWLPCGLVYSMLLVAAARAEPVQGGVTLLAFGIGTLPGMVGAGMASGAMRAGSAGPGLRRILGGLLIAGGLAYAAAHLAAYDAGAQAAVGVHASHLH